MFGITVKQKYAIKLSYLYSIITIFPKSVLILVNHLYNNYVQVGSGNYNILYLLYNSCRYKYAYDISLGI